jgi:hypothetical protein
VKKRFWRPQKYSVLKPVILQILVFFGGIFCAQLWADELVWVCVEGSAPIIGNTKESARRRAIQNAREKAVSRVVGTDISTEYLWANFRRNGSLAGAIPFVKVVESHVISEYTVSAISDDRDSMPETYKVELQAAVAEGTTGDDPHFEIKASLNRPIFIDGQNIRITMKASKDCYVWVFNILDDESVLRLVPNRFKAANALRAGKTYLFPSHTEVEQGMALKVHALEDRESTDEAVYILALKQPRDLRMEGIPVGIYNQFIVNNKTAFLKDLIADIITIPLDQRAETLIRYQIKGK